MAMDTTRGRPCMPSQLELARTIRATAGVSVSLAAIPGRGRTDMARARMGTIRFTVPPMAAAYTLECTSLPSRPGWVITVEDPLEGTKAVNDLHVAGIAYESTPGSGGTRWFVPAKNRRDLLITREMIVRALAGK